MRTALPLVLVFWLATPAAPARGEPDLDGFISWEQWRQSETTKATNAGRADDEPAVHEQVSSRTYIRFGAGASYLMPIRLGSSATGNKVWPEFSAWVAPFGRLAAIGGDLALGKDATLLFTPGLKLYVFESEVLTLYLEGSAGIYSHEKGTEFGGGGGAGLIIGLMDNLTIELDGSVTAFSLADEVVAGLLEQRTVADAPAAGLTLVASFGARLMTRF